MESQIAHSGETLARAFSADPLGVYMFPNLDERAKLLPWHYTTMVRYGFLFGEVYTTVGCDGVAVWLPQGDEEVPSFDRLEKSGIIEAPGVLGMAAFDRLISVTGHLEQLRKRHAPPRHWYLPVLGVDPRRQGRGLGGALLGPILARADAEGRACYLETLQSRNVPFYRRHGFEVVVEDVEPRSGLQFWAFRRDPLT